jgi:transcriptional activator of cad operon
VDAETISIGGWRADRSDGRLRRDDECRTVEPKVMDLLFVLAARPNQVVPREALMRALWPDSIVGEDTLARCVFKLRRALGDDSRPPRLIETIPKRGYRLIQAESALTASPIAALGTGIGFIRRAIAAAMLLAAAIAVIVAHGEHVARSEDPVLARAADSYFQYRPADNEAAIRLYERALANDPESAPALAGLSSALVQGVMRWQKGKAVPAPDGSALRAALASGRLSRPEAMPVLARALAIARRAASIDPDRPAILRALGLALSASGQVGEAASVYDRALALDPDDWGVLINRADLHDIMGRSDVALPLLERAYASMTRRYAEDPAKIRPWQARLGVEVGRRYEARSDPAQAERWYRRSLADDPASRDAADHLAALQIRL